MDLTTTPDSSRFDRHLFISYAHLDNQPLTPEQQGWVSRFHASLDAMLSMRLGRKALIWRDSKLTGNDIFADEIVAQFAKTAVLVSVLTPRYVESEWCTREVREFCLAAEQSGGLSVDNKARLIKVVKTPAPSEQLLPAVMREMLGYAFFTLDDEQTPLELDPAFGPELAQKYHLKVAKVAWDIAQLIRSLERTVPAESSSKPAIFLAECSYDRREARELIEAELRLHGYPVLPNRQLPRDEAEYVAETVRLIDRCKLSIHLVGGNYGAVPDGPSQKSVVVLQNEIAIRSCRAAGLRRIIWLEEGTSSSHSGQRQFIEALHNDADAQFGADLITADIEGLKGAIHALLRQVEQPAPANAAPQSESGSKLVYLICDERDRRDVIPLRKSLRSRGIDVKIPAFEGDAATVRHANQELLTQCEAVLLYYGTGDEAWKRSVDIDLTKMKGYRGQKPILACYTYLAAPATEEKNELIELEEPNLINGLTGFVELNLKPFLDTLQSGGGNG